MVKATSRSHRRSAHEAAPASETKKTKGAKAAGKTKKAEAAKTAAPQAKMQSQSAGYVPRYVEPPLNPYYTGSNNPPRDSQGKIHVSICDGINEFGHYAYHTERMNDAQYAAHRDQQAEMAVFFHELKHP
jgi:hypothetical protein